MEIPDVYKVARASNEITQLTEIHAEILHKLKKQNVFYAGGVSNGTANTIANKFFNCSTSQSHLFYLPSGNCWLVNRLAVVIPLSVSQHTMLVHDLDTVDSHNNEIYYSDNMGIVNTGPHSFYLISLCTKT